MQRFAALVVGACLLVGAVPVAAKKKPHKPVIESFEATLPGHAVLGFEVEEFSSDQDVQELAQAYANLGVRVTSQVDATGQVAVLTLTEASAAATR